MLALWLVGLSGLGPPAHAAGPEILTPDLAFVLGPDLGAEAGIVTIDSLARVLWLYDEPLAAALRIDETTTLGRIAGGTGRVLQFLFLDYPLAVLERNVVHEVFGHGARAREAGHAPRYHFRLPTPYDAIFEPGEVPYAAFTSSVSKGNLDQDVAMIAGGVDASQLRAATIGARVLRRGGRIHYSEALGYLLAKIDYVEGLADPRRARNNDVAMYVRLLALRHGRWTERSMNAVADDLQRAYLAGAFLDWTLWWSVYRVSDNLGLGNATGVVPMIPIGPVKLLPNLRFALSPFGLEHTLEVLAAYDGMQLGAYARTTFSGLASAWGGGAELTGWRPGGGLELGGALDVWSQPELFLEQRGVLDRRQAWGGSLALRLTWSISHGIGLTGKIAYKSRGYLLGQPLDAGFYGYVGLSLAFDGRPSLVCDDAEAPR